MKNLNNKRETLLSILSFTINLTCFVFVMWQIINCATRYFQKPRGTTTSYEKSTDLPFPAITVCSSNFYNENGLKKCGVQVNNYLKTLPICPLLNLSHCSVTFESSTLQHTFHYSYINRRNMQKKSYPVRKF